MSFISSLGEWLRKVSKSFMSATISGKTITLTRHNGDTVTLTTQDTTYEQASQSTSGLMSATDKSKLDGITAGAEPNQNAFASVLVGNINVAADTKSDTLTLVAGSNITLTPDATNDKITIAAKDTVTTVSTTGNGNAITSITASDGALTVKKDSTFSLSNHTHSYLPLSGGTLTGELTFANGTWNTVGDDVKIGDFDKAGLLGVMGANGTTGIAFCKRGDASNYKSITYDGTNLSLGGYTLLKSVPADAKFTDTVYEHPTTAGNKHIPAGGSSGQFLKWSSDGTATWAADNNTTYPAFSTARYINANNYVDAMIFYDNDVQSNRASVIRVTNGNGYHELLLGVNNESNGAPNGLSVRSTNGTITASLPGTLTVNGLKIGTSNIGSATKPVYVGNGTITACTNDAYYPSSTNISLDGVSLGYVTASQKEVQFLFPLAMLAPGSVKSCSITSVTMHTVNGTKTFSSGFTVSYAQLWSATGVIIRLVFTASTGITNNTPLTVACTGNLQFN